MSFMNGPGMMSQGPPITPPDTPSLSQIPQGEARPMESISGEGGIGAAIPRIIYTIVKALDTLAKAIPGQSEAIDNIRTSVKGLMDVPTEGRATGSPAMTASGLAGPGIR